MNDTQTDRQTSGVSHIALHSIQMLVQKLLTTVRQNITNRDRQQTVTVTVTVTVHINPRHAVAVAGQISIGLSILSLYHSSEPNQSTCNSCLSAGPKQNTTARCADRKTTIIYVVIINAHLGAA